MSERILLDAGPSGEGWSSIESFPRCQRKYYFDYVGAPELRILPKRGPLPRGALGHIGLAHFYTRQKVSMEGGNPDLYYEPFAAMEIFARNNGLDSDLLSIAQAAVERYMAYYGPAEFGKILMVEERRQATLTDRYGRTFTRTQRFDLATEDGGGRKWLYDHKFVAKPDNSTIDRYQISGQFILMRKFGRALFKDEFGGAIVNLVGVESGLGRFMRRILEPAPGAEADFANMVGNVLTQIQINKSKNDFYAWTPAFHEMVCTSIYKGGDGTYRCEYFDRCQWGA